MSEDMGLVLNKLDELYTRIDGMDVQLNARLDGVKGRLDSVETELTRVGVTVEQDISRMIDVIGEGHDFLKRRVADVEKIGAKSEKMELEIINLGIDVKQIKQHVALA